MTDVYQDFNQKIIDEFRAQGGNVTANGFGDRLVLVHHTGAKSGIERVAPVMALRTDDGAWQIAASKGGSPEHPGWYHNLRANPDVVIEIPDEGTVPVHAVVLEGAARDVAWKRFSAMSGFAAYEQRTSRTIPVIELRRR